MKEKIDARVTPDFQPSMKQSPPNLLPCHGNVVCYRGFFPSNIADRLFKELMTDIDWRQEAIRMFGRQIPQPRLTAWHGDKDAVYTYAGLRNVPRSWTPGLTAIKSAVEEATSHSFNSVLLNLYRNGRDYMGWHRDNEPELGSRPVIVSVSLGAERRFLLRRYKDHTNRCEIPLAHGDLLLMTGETQTFWEHSLPKSRMIDLPRINLTFRKIHG